MIKITNLEDVIERYEKTQSLIKQRKNQGQESQLDSRQQKDIGFLLEYIRDYKS